MPNKPFAEPAVLETGCVDETEVTGLVADETGDDVGR